MRAAHVQDAWKLLRRSRKRQVESIELQWSSVPGLSDGHAKFTSPITLICGENGAGKSRIMHAIFRAFRSQASSFSTYRFFRTAESESTKLTVWLSGDTKRLTKAKLRNFFFPEGEADRVILFCTALAIAEQLAEIRGDSHFEERLEGAVSRSFSDEQLKHASYVLARTYASVQAIEIEPDSNADGLRYFRATSHGVTYDSMEMGEGELAVLNLIDLLWSLESGSVVLIEEPESYLSPRAQGALVDVLAAICGSRGVTCILSSHSGAVAKRLELGEIFFVSRGGSGVTIQSPADKADLVERLGLLSPKSVVLLVEDPAAAILVRNALDFSSPALRSRGEIVVCDGAGNVTRSVSSFPSTVRSVACIGILDGDKRVDGPVERVCFLPGEVGPDLMLHSFATNAPPDLLASAMGVSSEIVERALNRADGRDPHDWFEEFGRQISCSKEDTIRRISSAWIRENASLVEAFVREVEGLVNE